MSKEQEHTKGKGCTVVVIVLCVNAAISVFLIAAMVYSLTRITQQQEEIVNLRELLHRAQQTKPAEDSEQAAQQDLEGKKSVRYEIKTKSKDKRKPELSDDTREWNENTVVPVISSSEVQNKAKCCGVRGKRGKHGQKGEKGDRGEKGDEGRDGRDGATGRPGRDGIPGRDGTKGEKGRDGRAGIKGSKGDEGPIGQNLPFESALLVGKGKKVQNEIIEGQAITSWRESHRTERMSYSNGFLTVKVDGYYYIYSQMYYYDETLIMGHFMKIDDRRVLKAVHSVAKKAAKYQTQYIGGVFKVTKGQKISVCTHVTRKVFYFEAESSYFGAFLLHSLE